jgi:hypothetical protein
MIAKQARIRSTVVVDSGKTKTVNLYRRPEGRGRWEYAKWRLGSQEIGQSPFPGSTLKYTGRVRAAELVNTSVYFRHPSATSAEEHAATCHADMGQPRRDT